MACGAREESCNGAALNVRTGGSFAVMSLSRQVFAAIVMTCALVACRHDDSVRIALINATHADMRCVAVLAHFVTVDLPVIPAGDTYRFTLVDTADGGLAMAHDVMGPMMLENLLCGLDEDWSRSVVTTDLAAAAGQDRTFSCLTDGDRLACRAPRRGGELLPANASCRRPRRYRMEGPARLLVRSGSGTTAADVRSGRGDPLVGKPGGTGSTDSACRSGHDRDRSLESSHRSTVLVSITVACAIRCCVVRHPPDVLTMTFRDVLDAPAVDMERRGMTA